MTPGRRAALIIGVPVCLVLVGWSGLSTLASFAEGRSPVHYAAPAGTTALTLNTDGQLTIKPTTASRATLTGTARYTFTQPALTEDQAGDHTTVGYNCTVPVGDCELDATVTVPASVTTLTAHSGSGDATVTGTTGPVTLSSGDGSLSVSQASGPLTLNSGSGNIQVSAITSATVAASTGDGDIGLTGVTSATTLTARSDSGSINGTGIAATSVTASTGNGSIDLTFTGAPPGNVHVNTDSGNVILHLPPGNTKYDISANSDTNSVSYPKALQDTASHHVITASSGNGSITIDQE